VNKQWRTATLNHSLWKKITITSKGAPSLSEPALQRIAQSKPYSLSFIELVESPSDDEEEEEEQLSDSRILTETIHKVVNRCSPQHLRKLCFVSCETIDEETLISVLSTPTLQLQTLKLNDLQITNKTLDMLRTSSTCKSLKNLSVDFCRLITDEAMISLLLNCPNLNKISIDETKLTKKTLMCIIDNYQHVTHISARSLPLSEEPLKYLAQHPLPSLKYMFNTSLK
jgi:hypothetical protein